MLGGPDLAQEAGCVEAGEEIDRLVAERAYNRAEGWLRETGMSEHAAHELVARALDRIDAGFPIGAPYNHIEGRALGGALTLAADAQLEAAQLEFEHEYGYHPMSRPAETRPLEGQGVRVASRRMCGNGSSRRLPVIEARTHQTLHEDRSGLLRSH